MRRHLPLTGIVLLAALLRLPTLGLSSLWLDEGYTYYETHASFSDLLRRVVDIEATPPLAFIYEWLATKVTGTSEFGLRLPFAIVGILIVPAVYWVARRCAGHRAGLIAAALAATNPMLVWHAQDARAYSLLLLLLVGTVIALQHDRRWWWAGLSVVALGTHSVAAFVVVPEAAWLLHRAGLRAIGAVAPPALAMAGVAVLASSQPDTTWIQRTSFASRAIEVVVRFFAGYQLGPGAAVTVAFVSLAVIVAGLRAGWPRPRARLIGLLGVATIALPVAAALVRDVLIPRAVIGALAAFLIVAAVGFERRRWGIPAAVALCAVWTVVVIAAIGDPKTRREDWRRAAKATRGTNVVLVARETTYSPMEYYRPDLDRRASVRTRLLSVLLMGKDYTSGCRLPPSPVLDRGSIVARGPCWRVLRYAFAGPRTITMGHNSLLAR